MRLKFVAFLLIFCISSTQQADYEEFRKNGAGFFFSMAKTLLSGQNETVCLSTHHAQSFPARVIVDLKLKEKHFFTTRILDTEHTCFELNVPNPDLIEPQFVSVRVQVQLNGIVYSSHNFDPIVLYPNKKITFIETDKGYYKAGDKVKIRLLTLSHNLQPDRDHKVPLVRIRNPLDTAVAAWENITTELGLVQLEHHLSKDAIEGKWRIESEGEAKTFKVTRYTLPRFNVQIIHPKVIFYEANSLDVKVCSQYSYGANVKGTAFIRLTDSHHNMQPLQIIKKMENGCAEFSFKPEQLSLLHIKQTFTMMDPKIHVLFTATVTEYGTDKIELTTSKALISLKPYTLKFVSENQFLPGLPYHGKLELNNIHTDLKGEVVEICYNIAIKRSQDKLVQFHVLPLANNVIHMQLNARSLNHSTVGDGLLVVRLYSASSSYMNIEQIHSEESSQCKSVQQFSVQYTTDKLAESQNITFYYMIKSRGQIHKLRRIVHNVKKHYPNYSNDFKDILGAKHKHLKSGSSIDKFLLKFKIDSKIISNYKLLLYYITDNGEIVAATAEGQIEPCLNNKVKATWSHKQIAPGAAAAMVIETTSESLCSISSVDKATKFMDDTQILNTRTFLRPFLHERDVPESGRKSCVAPVKKGRDVSSLMDAEGLWDLRRKKRYVYSFSEDYDAYDIFNKFGTITITNFKVVSKPCYTGPMVESKNAVQFLTDQYEDHNEDKIAPIRSFFPETWLWELIPVKQSATIHRTLPHSITNWVTNVLCISETDGAGFSETTEISSFQPFFVDILTPYSIKKGETLYLHVTLFNYLNYNLPIRITLGDSSGLKLVDSMNRKSVTYCVGNNSTVAHIFEMRGVEVGSVNVTVLAELDATYPGQCGPDVQVNKRDVVSKSLIVEPEGYPIKITKSALLCTSETHNSSNISWDIAVPENIVPDTAKTVITLNGDLLGQSIENLDNLIMMPTGCGEQIMASMAPNLYILRYLNVTKNLTPSLRQRMTRNLKIGYQRILNYAHKDGSFSAFGYHDPTGSMFLTAFVVRTLQESKEYIYVDQRVIDRAVSWILEHQLENGCFSTMLHVFQDMGGTSTENSTAGLTSYVMISLLEAKIDIPETVKMNAKYCIRGHYHLDKYTLAISSYALFKVNWVSEATRMLKKLEQISNQKDNMIWWSNRDVNGSIASDIEITSYVLLSLLHQDTQENLAKAHSIVRWLSSKQGPRGGFHSTQDTVVALDALAKYSHYLNSKKTDMEVVIETNEHKHKFSIKQDDRLKSKRIVLTNSKQKVNIGVVGEGCVLAQSVLSYYLKQLPTSDSFKLDLEVAPVSSVDECSIATISPCFQYNGPDSQANMAVLEVDLPSGYEADRASLYKLLDEENNARVKKFEELNRKVVFYLTKLDHQQVCVDFNINENEIVQSRSESTIKLYDYYKPEYGVVQFYTINEKCKPNNLTMPEIINASESGKNLVKRQLNPDFVNVNYELATPEGVEGNSVVYLKPNSNLLHNLTSSSGLRGRKRGRKIGSLNPDFVDKNVEMATPDGVEGNSPSYMKPNTTISLIVDNAIDQDDTVHSRKRRGTALNPDFVNKDMEMAMPEGVEGNMPTYTKLNWNMTFTFNNSVMVDGAHKRRKRDGATKLNKLNPDFVDKDMEMAMPDGIEGNSPSYAKPPKASKKN